MPLKSSTYVTVPLTFIVTQQSCEADTVATVRRRAAQVVADMVGVLATAAREAAQKKSIGDTSPDVRLVPVEINTLGLGMTSLSEDK